MSIQPAADPLSRIGDGLRGLRREHVLALGVGGACALGLVLGAWAKPHLREGQSPMGAVAATATPEGQMQIVVSAPRFAPPPAPIASTPLEVLPADMAAQARANAEALHTISAPPLREETPVEVEPAMIAAPAPRAGFDCREAQGLADQMVCGDASLARQDRRLARAYADARDAGVPSENLRAEQRDWMMIREDAAQQSPGALADVYEQRIAELAQMAAGEDR